MNSLSRATLTERVAATIHDRISEELAKVDRPNWRSWPFADEGSKEIYRAVAKTVLDLIEGTED
jgi:hypothetical protein